MRPGEINHNKILSIRYPNYPTEGQIQRAVGLQTSVGYARLEINQIRKT